MNEIAAAIMIFYGGCNSQEFAGKFSFYDCRNLRNMIAAILQKVAGILIRI